MKTKAILILILTLAALGAPGFAQDILYQTGFEPPAFTSGLPIRGQDGWEMFNTGEAISVSTTNAHTGAQCLRLDGSLLEPQASGSSTASCQLSPASLSAITGDHPPAVVEIQCDVRLDGPQVGTAGTPDLDKLSANFYAGTDAKYAGGFLVSSAGKIWTVSFAPGELYKYSVPYTFGTYRTLTLRVNYLARTLTYLVDGVELGSSPISPTNTDQALTRADLLVSGPTDPINTPEITYDPANYQAYYDNYRITALPPPPSPEIAVEQPAGTSLASGVGSVDFGSTLAGGSGAVRTFTIRNPGTQPLSGVAVRVDGPQAGEFAITANAASSVEAAGSTAFTVKFSPTAVGLRTASLRIASNDADENPFVIALTGDGLPPMTIAQQAYLKASTSGGPSPGEFAGDDFGACVAVAGDTIVVGAPNEDSSATGVNGNQTSNSAKHSGAAFVFVREGNTWTQQAYLKPSNTGADDGFGSSVAISGDTVIVGAPTEDSTATGVNGDQGNNSASDSGAAYVFVRNGDTWTQQAYLKASNTGANDWFGFAVVVSADTVVVGAYLEDSNAAGVDGNQSNNNAPDSGAAYVFVREGATWTQQAYLKASNPWGGDNFGSSVAISWDTVIVGAPTEDSNATGVNGDQGNNSAPDSGAAYVFVRNGDTWTQQAYLKASNTGANDGFGYAVAVWGDTVAVGAPLEASNAKGVNGNQADNSVPDAGAAYVFVRDGTGWTQQAYLKASNTGPRTAANGAKYGDLFGYPVSVSGDTIVVGAPYESSGAKGVNGDQTNSSAYEWAGAAYVFVRAAATWTQQGYLKASNTAGFDRFSGEGGIGAAVSGDTVVVGASGESSNATGVNGNQNNNSALESGAVYVFTGVGPARPVTAPDFLSVSRDLDAGVRLRVGVVPGRSYSLEVSTDLLIWSELTTLAATTNQIEFTERPPSNAADRFYRVKRN